VSGAAVADHPLATVSAQRIDALLDGFAALSAPGPGVTRLCHTPLERQAHDVFAATMRELGLHVRSDAAGNTVAERPGTRVGAPAIGTGSHLDSVPHGGRFDGVAGVVAAMEVARLLVDGDVPHVHPLRFVAFAAEEGARFGRAMNGSGIACGALGPADLDAVRDADGITMAEAMRSVGLDPAAVAAARWDPTDWAGFLELHIEQGSVLERAGVGVGLVDAISGSTRMALHLTGRASHTGGTPMHLRADAMAAAAEIVLQVEGVACDDRHRGTRATVGRLTVEPGSITTIAGAVDLSVDVRDVDADRQRATAAEIVGRASAIARRRGIGLRAEMLADAAPVVLPTWVRGVVADTAERLDVGYRVLPSGASHDSQMVGRIVPTGMIFVPSRDGISHAPQEWTATADIAAGTDLLAAALLELDRRLAG
jgi:allantoate deiminase